MCCVLVAQVASGKYVVPDWHQVLVLSDSGLLLDLSYTAKGLLRDTAI